MTKTIAELQAEKQRLERKRDLLSTLMAFVGAILVVSYMLFGRGAP